MATVQATTFKTPTDSDAALAEIVRCLVEAYRPDRIYLFGSVARGDAGPDSGYDIMVVVPDGAPRELQDCDLAYQSLRGMGVAKVLKPRCHPRFSATANYFMPPDPVRAADPPDQEGSLFHSQQEAEKALKAFLTWHDVPFLKVPEPDLIGKRCASLNSSLADLMSRADLLSQYAWRFRYPGAPYEPTIEEARTASGLAHEIVESILN